MVIINKNTKVVLWKPSGGLGHCLSNLAWTINLCIKNNCELCVYRFDQHRPYGHYALDTLDFLNKTLKISEIKNDDGFLTFIEKHNIQPKYKSIILNARYNTGLKSLNNDQSIFIVCSAAKYELKGIFKFKQSFINNILNNPYKYYKNDYPLLNDDKDNLYSFNISGSYYKSLGIGNHQLGITAECKEYLNIPKMLTIDYTLIDGEKKIIVCKEYNNYTLQNIKNINNATYGIKDKIINVTSIIINKLTIQDSIKEYNYSIKLSGSYYKAFNISNKQLNIPNEQDLLKKTKVLTINYINCIGDEVINTYKDKDLVDISDIKVLNSAKYGVDNYTKCVISIIKKKYMQKHEIIDNDNEINTYKNDKKSSKNTIEEIVKNKQYIAVHFRYRDKKVQGGLHKKISEIETAINETGISNIFIATDSSIFFHYLSIKLKNVVLFRYTSPPEHGINIHYNSNFEKGENLYKTLLDIYTCKNAHTFIQSIGSGFSNLINTDI